MHQMDWEKKYRQKEEIRTKRVITGPNVGVRPFEQFRCRIGWGTFPATGSKVPFKVQHPQK